MAKTPESPRIGARFFPYGADVQSQVDAWARRANVRVIARIPVYWEVAEDGQRKSS